tara:strand:- start:64 stop:282 length:219 start_codon:yes stop_codon:yes gene_type:complete
MKKETTEIFTKEDIENLYTAVLVRIKDVEKMLKNSKNMKFEVYKDLTEQYMSLNKLRHLFEHTKAKQFKLEQ